MKKSIETIITIGTLTLALILIVGAVWFHISSLTVQASESKALKYTANDEICEEDKAFNFSNLNDYLRHLANDKASFNDDTYYNSESVPTDAELVGISVSDEGTAFKYWMDRNPVLTAVQPSKDNDNVISFEVGDTLLDGLTRAAIVKYYGNNLYNVTDYVEFAETLAEDIGAPLISSDDILDIYAGNIYADIYDPSTQIQTRYFVGTQRVFCMHMNNNPVVVSYSYVPASVTETEANLFTNMVEHTISTNND